jgi:short-subunit dehydrogenase
MPRAHSPLENRTVVVTGAARGLGAAQARALARRGARLALLGHERPDLEAVAASLPTPALAVEADVTDEGALREAAETVRARLGPPSAVVANAGIAEGLTAHTFLPDLRQTAGYYLQIASLASLGAAPLMSAYCAAKAGVEAFAHALRAEEAHRGVAVGIAYMSWTDTDLIRDADRHAALHELRAHLPPPARRVHPVDAVAEPLARAVERRSTAVYVPAWLRLAQLARPALPSLVLRATRRALPVTETEKPLHPTGLLGAGGRADRDAGTPR